MTATASTTRATSKAIMTFAVRREVMTWLNLPNKSPPIYSPTLPPSTHASLYAPTGPVRWALDREKPRHKTGLSSHKALLAMCDSQGIESILGGNAGQ